MFSFLFGDLDRKLDLIINQQRTIMATQQEFEAGFQRIDAATTTIGQMLRDIGSNLGSMTAEQEDEARNRLNAAADALEALAAQGPTNPVPIDPETDPAFQAAGGSRSGQQSSGSGGSFGSDTSSGSSPRGGSKR